MFSMTCRCVSCEHLRSGNVWVTGDSKYSIQLGNRVSQKCRREMLVSCGHAQVLMTEQLRDCVDVSAIHP
jgi:hypothetical protein